MDLRTYLDRLSPQQKEQLASIVGTKPVYLIHLAGRHRTPSPELAIKIWRATAEEVSLAELRPDIWGANAPVINVPPPSLSA